MHVQIATGPTHRAQPLTHHVGYGLLLLHRAYHFYELTSSKTRFQSSDSANIFFNSAFLFFSSFNRLASARSISLYLRFHR